VFLDNAISRATVFSYKFTWCTYKGGLLIHYYFQCKYEGNFWNLFQLN